MGRKEYLSSTFDVVQMKVIYLCSIGCYDWHVLQHRIWLYLCMDMSPHPKQWNWLNERHFRNCVSATQFFFDNANEKENLDDLWNGVPLFDFWFFHTLNDKIGNLDSILFACEKKVSSFIFYINPIIICTRWWSMLVFLWNNSNYWRELERLSVIRFIVVNIFGAIVCHWKDQLVSKELWINRNGHLMNGRYPECKIDLHIKEKNMSLSYLLACRLATGVG